MKWACSLVALLTAIAPGAFAQEGAPRPAAAPNGSTAIEQALIEHACRAQLPGLAGDDAYQDCLSARFRSLRADFGRDLSRISTKDRNALDASCSTKRQAEGREAYLECLAVQLVSIRNRQRKGGPVPLQEAPILAPEAPLEGVQSASLAIPEGALSPSLSPLRIGAALVALMIAGGGALMAVKRRRTTRKCRVCGGDVPEAGDLCPPCRHEAAEALRHAAAGRADQERALIEEQRRHTEREGELRRQRALEEEEARARQQQEALRREEDARRREEEEEESRQRGRTTDVDSEDVFDPHAVLGVPQDAGKEAIDAACQDARLKYAPDQVAHLGPELQEHYRRKAEAVERAYAKLSE